MLRNPRIKRVLAIFLLTNMVIHIFQPVIAYASLTAGPTAPEYTSFEPVDTTDMVNLASGDFTYNIPLLEVPGPEGGYPLSLSYHAGIKPNQEASWVGLGWTLNPGAINRYVNGFPDDHLEATRTRTDAWSGGERSMFSVGIGYAGVSFGLTFANDTYEGFGVGMNIGVGTGIGVGGEGSGIGVSVGGQMGAGPYGNTYGGVSAGLSVGKAGKAAKGLTANIGVSTNFNSVSGNTGIGYRDSNTGYSTSLLGASISSKGLKPSISAAGFSANQVNSNAGRITTESSGFNLTIPLPGGWHADLGYNYLRYYSFESSDVKVIGTLNAKQAWKGPDDYAFDSYALKNPSIESAAVEEDDPEKDKGGSFPSYDNYQVTAQGLSGSIQPYIFESGTLYRQNLKKEGSDTEYLIEYKRKSSFSKKVNFRFKNDFSNRLTYNNAVKLIVDDDDFNYENTIRDTQAGGFNTSDNHLAGSRHIEWFTNEEISDGNAQLKGFIEYPQHQGGVWAENIPSYYDQIGGFMVTNESGVTYHYALPVYAYDEYSKSFVEDDEGTYQSNQNGHAYAYTWLLTAITGPDYVDRGVSNKLDEEDWGYWVKFDYGFWAKDYQWRNPLVGHHKNLQKDIKTFSKGKKEIYYLDAISTRTHTAIFEKEIRADGKGTFNTNNPDNNVGALVKYDYLDDPDCDPTQEPYCPDLRMPYYLFSTASLRLNRILLFQNKDLEGITTVESLKETSDTYDHVFDYSDDSYNYERIVRVHHGKSVIDKYDISEHPTNLEAKSLRTIELDHTYDLANGTTNSFDSNGAIYRTAPNTSLANTKLGKLTLTKLRFLGKQGTQIIPPIDFEYANNPNYQQEHYDTWGMYKSDYQSGIANESLNRVVTPTSAENTDAWSLTSITSSLGAQINIEYESDSYQKPELYKAYNLNIEGYSYNSSLNKTKLIVGNGITGLDDIISAGSTINAKFLKANPYLYQKTLSKNDGTSPSTYHSQNAFDTNNIELSLTVENIAFDTPSSKWEITIDGFILPYETPKTNLIGSQYLYECTSNVLQKNPCGGTTIWQGWGREYETFYYNQAPTIIAGNIAFSLNANYIGGGIRVHKVSIINDGISYHTRYKYHDTSDESLTSGVTSYEPYGEDVAMYVWPDESPYNGYPSAVKEEKQKIYEPFLHEDFYDLLAITREVPAPGVTYQYVTVEESIQHGSDPEEKLPGKKVYEFQPFTKEMVERTPISQTSETVTVDEPVWIPPCTEGECDNSQQSSTSTNYRIIPPGDGGDDGGGGSGCNCDCDCDGNGYYDTIQVTKTIHTVSPITLKDYTARVGALKSVTTYGASDQIIEKITNHYLHDDQDNQVFRSDLSNNYQNQGVVSQLFNEYRIIENDDGNKEHLHVFSRRDEYPLVSLGQTVENHKTGVTTTSTNLAFDFYTGEPIEVLTKDSYGNKYLSISTPAYTEYPGMGLKINNINNKHMLTQNAASSTYKVKDDGSGGYTHVGLVSASVQTWKGDFTPLGETTAQSNIWRKHRSYNWVGDDNTALRADGLYPAASFTEFTNWNSGEPPVTWQKNAEITLYDVYSHALEVKDLNRQYAATKMDINQEKVYATAALARYGEFAYSGAEDYTSGATEFGGGVKKNAGTIYTNNTHTGDKVMRLTGGQKGFEFSTNSISEGTYRVSVWSTSSNVNLKYKRNGGSTQTASKLTAQQAGNWYLLRANITVPTSTTSLDVFCEAGTTVYVDDFRFHPLQSAMSSYVYNEWGELSHILDANNLYTRFEYDAAGKLKAMYKERIGYSERKLSEQETNYSKTLD